MGLLQDLPEPGAKRMAIRVTADALRQVRAGHPWVFDASIQSMSHSGSPGDLAVIFDKNRNFVAIGLYDPMSPIRIRILHRGKPQAIDPDFWLTKLVAAADHRGPLAESGDTSGYRILNGENDGFGGLVLDRYGDSLVLKVYSEAWIPHLRTIVGIIDELLEPTAMVLRLSRSLQDQPTFGLGDGMALLGVAPSVPIEFTENGLVFEVDLVHGQKTGHFLDQRDNRAMAGGLASGARVLDVFSCTGGFSVHAAAGGATEVVSVDQSSPALDSAKRNMELNIERGAVGSCRHSTVQGDAFAVMRQLADRGEVFDLVVIDPPAFAQRQANVDRALQSYWRLAMLGLELVSDGDWLMAASCSSRVSSAQFAGVLADAAAASRVELRDSITTGHALDHPVTFPEGEYLKAVFARVSR